MSILTILSILGCPVTQNLASTPPVIFSILSILGGWGESVNKNLLHHPCNFVNLVNSRGLHPQNPTPTYSVNLSIWSIMRDYVELILITPPSNCLKFFNFETSRDNFCNFENFVYSLGQTPPYHAHTLSPRNFCHFCQNCYFKEIYSKTCSHTPLLLWFFSFQSILVNMAHPIPGPTTLCNFVNSMGLTP